MPKRSLACNTSDVLSSGGIRSSAKLSRRQLQRALLALILLGAFGLRVWNIDWDQGQHLHPDERFWNQITDAVEPADGISGYFDSRDSPLNPYQYSPTFVYGTSPLFLTKATASWLQQGITDADFPANAVAHTLDRVGIDLITPEGNPTFDSGYNSHVIGRLWSALFDTATVGLVYLIGRRLFSVEVGLVAAAIIATTALHIQYSHFYGAETIATFFVTLTGLGAVRIAQGAADWRWNIITGAALGMAIAVKLNSIVGVAAVLAAVLVTGRSGWPTWLSGQPLRLWQRVERALLIGLVSIGVFRIAQPYAFSGGLSLRLDRRFIEDLSRLAEIQTGVEFPPNVQWVDRVPLLFPLSQLARWGLGPAAAILAVLGLVAATRQLHRRQRLELAVPLAMVAAMTILIATRRTPTLRYLLPIYPMLAVFAANGAATLWRKRGRMQQAAQGIAVALVALSILWGLAFTSGVYGATHSRIAATEWMAENVPDGSTVSAQLWDDGLPLRLPSVQGFSVDTITLRPFDTDSPDAINELITALDQIDYIVESSNRVYDSVPRIPARYPATVTYYEALFGGDLGFEKVAEFRNPPGLFGITIDDSRAEEAFTVYDHPTVTIWRKTSGYDRQKIVGLLDPDRGRGVIGVLPRDADANALLLRPDTYQDQQLGGTFNSVFRGGIGGTVPWLWWFLFIELAAVAVVPWVTWIFARAPGSGYGFTKVIGLLAVALPVWLAVAWDLTSMSRGLAWISWLAVIAIGAFVARRRWSQLIATYRENRMTWLTAEAVFIAAFFAFLAIRAANPDLWHPFRGGEKPMELAYLTSVTRSSALPPYDPWFAGGSMNYFYFGFFVLAIPIRALGILPEIGFNLGVATYAALAASTVFAVTSGLGRPKPGSSQNVRTGLLGVVMLLIGGNYAMLRQHGDRLRAANEWDTLGDIPVVGPVFEIVGGTWRWVRGADLAPVDWWAPSRVNGGLDITEFPAWSFLFGDLHPHVMGITMLLLVIATAWLYLHASRHDDQARRWVAVVGLGLTTGIVRMTNTWDLVTAVLLTITAIGAAQVLTTLRMRQRITRGACDIALVGAIHLMMVWPYIDNSQVFDNGVNAAAATTPIAGWLTQFALFIAAALSYLVWRGTKLMSDPDTRPKRYEVAMVGGSILVLGLVLGIGYSPVAGLSGVLAACFAVLLVLEAQQREVSYTLVTVLFMFGFGITAGVDLVTIDNDIERLNTVFKFWYQAWTLLAVAAAFGITSVVAGLKSESRPQPVRAHDARKMARKVWGTSIALLLAATLAFPLSAIRPRVSDRFEALDWQLDGMAYLREDPTVSTDAGELHLGDDLVLIDWLRDNVIGSPTIVEAVGPAYQWAGRFSIYTGLPAVIGWENHQIQQRRLFGGSVIQRRLDTDAFWKTSDRENAASFLRGYDVSFVIVGTEELRLSDPMMIEMLDSLHGLEAVFEDGPMRIYQVDKRAIRGLDPGDPLSPFVAATLRASSEDVTAGG